MEREEFSKTLEKYDGLFNPFTVKVGDLDSSRVSIDIPKSVHQKLKNITVDNGFFQRSLSMFIYCLSDYCDQLNIKYYSPLEAKEFNEFIRGRCTLVNITGNGHREDVDKRVKKTPTRTAKRGRKSTVAKGGDHEE